jgi:next to BRCA1 gene 1 protein
MHTDCPDFDLCEGCEAHPIPMHPDKHPLLKIKSAETVIPKIHNNCEMLHRSTSPPVATPRHSFDYGNGYIYNPYEVVSSSPVQQLNPQPEFGPRSPIYYPLPPSHPLPAQGLFIPPPPLPAEPGFFVPTPPLPDHYYPYPTRSVSPNSYVSPFIPPTSQYGQVASPFAAQHDSTESLDPSPRSSRPVTPVWQRTYDPTMSNPFMSAQEAANSKNKSSVTSLGTWVPPSHELDHLIQEQPAAPKSVYKEAQATVNGNHISERSTPYQSPLGNEALLNRPASTNVTEPSDIAPVSSANRSLAALLDDYRSTTSLAPSSLATSVDEGEATIQGKCGGVVMLGPDDHAYGSAVQKALIANFVADITVPDGQKFPPGAEFVKCWRMINDGERDWPESTELVFVAGKQLLKESSPQSVRVGRVKIGSEVDLWTGELKVY